MIIYLDFIQQFPFSIVVSNYLKLETVSLKSHCNSFAVKKSPLTYIKGNYINLS